MSLFVEGKLFNIANAESGGGSGDQHNLGWYATPEALRTAHATANDGDWAIVGSTDTVWVWDTDNSAWVDTDTKGEVSPDMVIIKSATMPTASTTPAGAIYMYTGLSNATYTNGYIYKNVKTATYTGTVSFEAATISGTTVACSGDNFANFLTESGVEPLSVVSGTMTYDTASALWVLVGKNANNETVLTFQEYQQDFVDAGFTFTGTPEDGDVIAFTCTVEEASATYAWTRIDVQPAGATYTAGNGISITNNEVSVADPVLMNKSNKEGAIAIGDNADAGKDTVAIGNAAYNFLGKNSVAIGKNAGGVGSYAIAIGNNAHAATNSILLSCCNSLIVQNNDANTFKVANQNGNFEIMSADGTVPTDRLTKVNSTITLTAAGWSNGSQTVSVSGITSTGVVFVSPDPTDQADYTTAGIICTAQATDSLTFTCDTTPSSDISVVVVQM